MGNNSLKTMAKMLLYPFLILYRKRCYDYAKKHPKQWADKLYKRNFGRSINWEHPTEFNEKIRWMQFYTDTSEWSMLADKYRVRDYLKGKGYGHILVKLYGKWDKAEDIDFDSLPDSFILKTNHGYGEIIIVKDKKQSDLSEIRKKMQRYLDTPFGIETAEPHYLKIKPCIIAEELLVQDGNLSSSLIDYKFYCFHGIPEACGVFYDRNLETHRNGFTPYDMNWMKHEEWRREDITKPCKDIPRPATFELMRQVCKDLASQFPFVRMDFYEVNGKLYFGEFTFTPAALSGGSFSKEKVKDWGEKIIYKNKF